MGLKKNKITTLFLKYPRFFIRLISKYYPFDLNLLLKHEYLLDWSLISENEAISWDADIIKAGQGRWDWKILSTNPAVFRDVNLIEIFNYHIHWEYANDPYCTTIASNTGINWTIELIEKYEDLWDYHQMSHNTHIPWTESLIDKYINKWDWESMSSNQSLPWTESLIDKYVNKWDWESMGCNQSLPWSLDFLEKYKYYLDKNNFDFIITLSLIGSVPIIEKYGHILSWREICSNSELPWHEENLLVKWADKIEWDGIAGNELLISNPLFFEEHFDKWLLDEPYTFQMLSISYQLPWSIPFIDRFIEFWEWEYLVWNKSLPWSIDFIEYYSDKLNWGGFIDDYIYEDDNANTLDTPIPTKEIVRGLINNEALPWSIEFINHFEKNIEFELLSSNLAVWEKAFKPYVDEKMIEIVSRII